MVKKRERQEKPAVKNHTTAGNLINSESTIVSASLEALDQNAPRKFKGINIQLNEYEYRVLLLASQKDKRGVTAFARKAIVENAEDLLKEK